LAPPAREGRQGTPTAGPSSRSTISPSVPRSRRSEQPRARQGRAVSVCPRNIRRYSPARLWTALPCSAWSNVAAATSAGPLRSVTPCHRHHHPPGEWRRHRGCGAVGWARRHAHDPTVKPQESPSEQRRSRAGSALNVLCDMIMISDELLSIAPLISTPKPTFQVVRGSPSARDTIER
jgi:hypothetical protein